MELSVLMTGCVDGLTTWSCEWAFEPWALGGAEQEPLLASPVKGGEGVFGFQRREMKGLKARLM
jgi:hypothetical protein